MNEKRTTIRDIAKEAGVHFTTVSRALAHHPSIPEKTSTRIRAIADKLGYVPDPMLSSLMSYRTRLATPAYQGNIAWVTNSYTRNGWAEISDIFQGYYDGALQRAKEFGYKLDEFWLREPGMNTKRASEILTARNIRGLIFAPQPKSKIRIKLDWPRFTAVKMGYTLAWPNLHTIANNTFFSIQNAVHQARLLGYRRIGLILNRVADVRINHGWLGGYLALQQSWPVKEHVPVFYDDFSKDAKLMAWLERHRPDAIVCHEQKIYHLLKDKGVRMPEDFGYLSQSLVDFPPHVAGVDENAHDTGVAAVNILVGMLQRGERGIPDLPQSTLITGTWRMGSTLKRQTSAKISTREVVPTP